MICEVKLIDFLKSISPSALDKQNIYHIYICIVDIIYACLYIYIYILWDIVGPGHEARRPPPQRRRVLKWTRHPFGRGGDQGCQCGGAGDQAGFKHQDIPSGNLT